MRTTRWICLLPAVVGTAMLGCSPGLDEVDRVAAAAEVALEQGGEQDLEALLCDWLEGRPNCMDLDVGGLHGPPAQGMIMGSYGPGDPEWGEDVGVFFGRYLGFDDDIRGHLDGYWVGRPGEPGGFFEGSSHGPDPVWRGEILGEHQPHDDQSGRFYGAWVHDRHEAVEEIAGGYTDYPAGDGGRFVGIWRAQEEDPEPTVHRLHIRNEIDGRSSMTLGTYQAWYHHDDYAAPGMHYYFGADDAGSEPARPSYIQGVEWYPQWPEDGENRWCDCESSVFESQPPDEVLVPYADAEITLEVIEGRGEVSIMEYPSEENDYQLTVEWDDNPQGGPSWYDIAITFVTD